MSRANYLQACTLLLALTIEYASAAAPAQPTPTPTPTPGSFLPSSVNQAGLTIPIQRRHEHVKIRKRDTSAVGAWAKREKARIAGRYGSSEDDAGEEGLQPLRRRQAQQGNWVSTDAVPVPAWSQGASTQAAHSPETTGEVGLADLTNYLADL